MKVIDKIVSVSRELGGWLLAGTVLFLAIDVVLRFFFNRPITAVYEITEELLMIIFIFLAMASAGHVSVDFIVVRLAPSARHNLKLATLAISFIFVMAIFIGATYKLFFSVIFSEGTECQLAYSLWPARLMVAVGLGSLAAVQVTSFIKELTGASS